MRLPLKLFQYGLVLLLLVYERKMVKHFHSDSKFVTRSIQQLLRKLFMLLASLNGYTHWLLLAYRNQNTYMCVCTNTHMLHTHARTHAHAQDMAFGSHVNTQLLPPSEQALGCLYTTQALEPFADKSFWGGVSNPQEDCPSLTDRGCGTQSHTTISHC